MKEKARKLLEKAKRARCRHRGPDNKKQSLGREKGAKFVERLCKHPGSPQAWVALGAERPLGPP